MLRRFCFLTGEVLIGVRRLMAALASFQNLHLLTTEKNSPTIWGHCRQLNGIEFFNPLYKRFADAMPAVQHLSAWRENDGITQISLVDVSRVLPNGSACRQDVQ